MKDDGTLTSQRGDERLRFQTWLDTLRHYSFPQVSLEVSCSISSSYSDPAALRFLAAQPSIASSSFSSCIRAWSSAGCGGSIRLHNARSHQIKLETTSSKLQMVC